MVAVPETEAPRLTEYVETFAATVKQELARTEPDLQIAATPAAIPDTVMTPDAQRRIVGALYGMPERRDAHERQRARPGGNVDQSRRRPAAKGTIHRGLPGAQRGQLGTRRRRTDGHQRVRRWPGSTAVRKDAFTGWKPNPDSPLLALMQSVYRDLWGHEAAVEAVHAGLETSEFGATVPGTGHDLGRADDRTCRTRLTNGWRSPASARSTICSSPPCNASRRILLAPPDRPRGPLARHLG